MSESNPTSVNSLVGSDHHNYLHEDQNALVGASNNDVIDTTYTSGTEGTASTSQTIADQTTPTVAELLQYCLNLEAVVTSLQQAMIKHGLMADS